MLIVPKKQYFLGILNQMHQNVEGMFPRFSSLSVVREQLDHGHYPFPKS